MKTYSRKINYLIIFSCVLFSSCTLQTTSQESFPPLVVSKTMMNTVFCIQVSPQLGNTYKNNKIFNLQLRNLSDKTIVFPSDYGIQLYTKEGENWIQVANTMLYPQEINILPPANKFPPGLIFGFVPHISDISNTPKVIRVIIIGHYENSENEFVGAYLDVKIFP